MVKKFKININTPKSNESVIRMDSKRDDNSLINELKKERNKKDLLKESIVDDILEQCLNNIKMINTANKTKCLYNVPLFLNKYPIYDINIISYEVNKKLKKKGFKTLYIKPNNIYISWG